MARYIIQAKQPLYKEKKAKGETPNSTDGKKVKVTLVKSTIGCLKDQQQTVEALGLHKIRQSKIHAYNDAIAGMIFKVKHLVEVEEISE